MKGVRSRKKKKKGVQSPPNFWVTQSPLRGKWSNFLGPGLQQCAVLTTFLLAIN